MKRNCRAIAIFVCFVVLNWAPDPPLDSIESRLRVCSSKRVIIVA